jgi:hypothetical protein
LSSVTEFAPPSTRRRPGEAATGADGIACDVAPLRLLQRAQSEVGSVVGNDLGLGKHRRDCRRCGMNDPASLTLGAGQFCTNPGLILAPEGRALEDFVAKSVGERAYLEGRAG